MTGKPETKFDWHDIGVGFGALLLGAFAVGMVAFFASESTGWRRFVLAALAVLLALRLAR